MGSTVRGGQEAAGGLGKDEVKGEADEDDEVAEVERAKQHYATKVVGAQSAVRARSEPRLGLSHHLFRTEQERIEMKETRRSRPSSDWQESVPERSNGELKLRPQWRERCAKKRQSNNTTRPRRRRQSR